MSVRICCNNCEYKWKENFELFNFACIYARIDRESRNDLMNELIKIFKYNPLELNVDEMWWEGEGDEMGEYAKIAFFCRL